jgi:proteasome accessory factor B
VPTSKTERLLQVVLCLSQGRRYVTKDQLREVIPDYAACPTTDAFERMFERDKNELRELGVPLETGAPGIVDDDPGYRIDREAYALPPLHLTRDEMTAVALAARVWREPGPANAAARALLKLQADGASVDPGQLPAIEPRLSGGEAAFEPLMSALSARRAVRFPYQGARDSEPRDRDVQPWGLVSRRGRWYVVGFDRGRDDVRVFRLSRIAGEVVGTGPFGSYEVPPDVDLRAQVDTFDEARPTRTATVRVRPGAGFGLRRRGTVTASAADDAADAGPGGFDTLEVAFSDSWALAEEVASYGAAVVALEPPDLREAVVRRLQAVASEGC